MKTHIAKEVKKRESAKLEMRYSRINWEIKKKEIKDIFEKAFDNFKIDGKDFIIEYDLNSDFSNKVFKGYDLVQVSHPMRYTGNRVYTTTETRSKDGSSTHKLEELDRKKEIGATLSITTSALGLYNVFLTPSMNDDNALVKEDILIYYSRNPEDLTLKRIEKFIKKFLLFQRVDSLFEKASRKEKIQVYLYRLLDVRNREAFMKTVFKEFRHWGAVLLAALLAFWVARSEPTSHTPPSAGSISIASPTQTQALPSQVLAKSKIRSYSTKEEYNGQLSLTLKTDIVNTYTKIDLTLNRIGAEHGYFNQLSIGDKVTYGIYEVTYTHIEKELDNYYACFKIIKV